MDASGQAGERLPQAKPKQAGEASGRAAGCRTPPERVIE